MRSSLLDIQLTRNNRPTSSTALIRMHIQPPNRFRRSGYHRQLQFCVPLVNIDGQSYRLRDYHDIAETLRQTITGTRQPLH